MRMVKEQRRDGKWKRQGLLADNGPCKQVCRVVGDTAMCSCFPGYAIMADGVSCEGESPPPT